MIQWLFSVDQYTTQDRRYRARVIYAVIGLITLFYALYAFGVSEWTLASEPGETYTLVEFVLAYPELPATFILVSMILVTVVGYVATRLGLIYFASWVPVALWFIGGVALLMISTNSPGDSSGAVILLLLLSGLLNGRKGVVAAWLLSIGLLALRSLVLPYDDPGIAPLNIAIQMTAGALLVYLFLRFVRFSRFEGAAVAMETRVAASEVVTQIARRVADRASLEVLLAEIVEGINNEFDFVYHVQVFLTDGARARLVASTGAVGQQLIERGHSLGVGTKSVIGQVTFDGSKPVVALAGAPETVHQANPLLPETAVEAAFPLRVGDRIIGALDVQSKQADAFEDDNLIAAFQALADSITLAIDNTQQYESAQTQLAENARLVAQKQSALEEVQRLNERLTGRAWSEYLRTTRQSLSLEVDFDNERQTSLADWTPTLQEAMQINHLVQSSAEGGGQVIAVPLTVRGRVIGAMEFELDSDANFAPEDLDLVNEISERFSMAVENARLVDTSQRAAEREALVNEISARIQTTNDVETMLAQAAQNLQQVLKADKVAIKLGSPEESA